MTDTNNPDALAESLADHAATALAEARARCDELRTLQAETQAAIDEALHVQDAIWDAVGGQRDGESLVDAVRMVARQRDEIVASYNHAQEWLAKIVDAAELREGEDLLEAVRRLVRSARLALPKPERVEVGQWWNHAPSGGIVWRPFRVLDEGSVEALSGLLRDPDARYLGNGERPAGPRPRIGPAQRWRDAKGREIATYERDGYPQDGGPDLVVLLPFGQRMMARTGDVAPSDWSLVSEGPARSRREDASGDLRGCAVYKGGPATSKCNRCGWERMEHAEFSARMEAMGVKQERSSETTSDGCGYCGDPACAEVPASEGAPLKGRPPTEDEKRRFAEISERLKVRYEGRDRQPEPPADADERWQPGAVWELRGARMEIDDTSHWPTGRHAHVRGLVGVVLCAAMTEANGWRYVGRSESEAPQVIRIERSECPETGELLYRRSVPASEASAIERAHTDGLVEGLRRAVTIVRERGSDGSFERDLLNAFDRAAHNEVPGGFSAYVRALLLAKTPTASAGEDPGEAVPGEVRGAETAGAGESIAQRVDLASRWDERARARMRMAHDEDDPAKHAYHCACADTYATCASELKGWLGDRVAEGAEIARQLIEASKKRDADIDVWRAATGCETPADARREREADRAAMATMQDRIAEIEREAKRDGAASVTATQPDVEPWAGNGAQVRAPRVGDMVDLRVSKGVHPCVVLHVWGDGSVNLRDLFDLDEVEGARRGDGIGCWRLRG